MEFLYGALTMVLFLCALLAFFYAGYKHGSKRTANTKPPDNDELRKAREHRQNFMDMMNYDVETALQRKKVQ
jgi:hypothetical protein